VLKKSRRLSTKQFSLAIEKGKVIHSPLFIARALFGQKDDRVAAVAPVKIAKTAVIRNRTRRKMYEAVAALGQLPSKGAHTIIFAKAGAVTAQKEELVSDLKDLFVNIGIL
jgi:ribonuclease P protein component